MNFLYVTLAKPDGTTTVKRVEVSRGRDLMKAAEGLLQHGVPVHERPPGTGFLIYPASRILLISTDPSLESK